MGSETDGDPGSELADTAVDDEFRAVMEGLRTTLPGSQVLFGFLLVLPLQSPFVDIDTISRWSYYVAFLSAAVSSVLLIAPSAHQRLRAPVSGIRRRSSHHLLITVWITIAGTVALAIALAASVFLVSRLVFAGVGATVATIGVTATILWIWFYVPLVTFERLD